MSRRAFAHLVEVAFPGNLAEMVRHVEEALPLNEIAERAVDGGGFGRLAGERHGLAHQVVVQYDIRPHTHKVYHQMCIATTNH